MRAQIGGTLDATPLDDFLIERYVYYSVGKRGELMSGSVVHPPYALEHAEVVEFDQSLLEAAAVKIEGPPVHVRYCGGVESTVYPPTVNDE